MTTGSVECGHVHGGAGHSHAPANFGRAFLIGTLLNVGFVIVEAGYGIAVNSVALLADAGHNLSDVFGLLIAWGAATLSKRKPSAHYSYGLRRTSILAALFNAVFLLVAIGAIAFEAVQRLIHPQPVEGSVIMAVAAVGIVINGFTALLFAGGLKSDINIRGAFLHMAADAAVSAGVVVAGFLVTRTGWLWLDPATSLVIVIVILIGTWGLLRSSVAMSLDRVPDGIAPAEVESALMALPGVIRVHDLHIWPMSTTDVALTCHLVMPAGCPGDSFLHDASAMLHDRFEIDHSTIQVERDEHEACALAPATVI
ncbi:cation diffusion facilitator family transporter [Sphingomonas sp. G124]|uniref:Cation diffusion facilitator family transporter n=1 Tax=Sphingomonas cremea TaxID=2904799 RepID=A0A9X1QK36_9SPHN|nr:cation diffusion facilitator family transporter [Sphingomonas cremea]MCF2514004.1 cation diffusion facilitator family transporter [Sphingomonas cremea]